MARLDASLNPDVFEDLSQAVQARPLLTAAGVPLRLWETYCLSCTNRLLLRRQLGRLSGGLETAIHPELLEKLRVIREQSGPLVERLSSLLPSAGSAPEDLERRDMMLGFIVMSPAARDAALQWTQSPGSSLKEAEDKLKIIESIVERYRVAIEAEVPKSAPGAVEVPVPAAAPEPPLFQLEAEHPPASLAAPALPAPAVSPAPAPAPGPPPPAPKGLTAKAASGAVTLSWEETSEALSYSIKRALGRDGPYTPIARSTRPAALDPDPPEGVTCSYVVTALGAGGESLPSAPAHATRLSPPPPPSGVRAVPGSGEVILGWSASPGAQSYVIKRATSPAGPFVMVATSGATQYVDLGLANGTTYSYIVAALNSGGEGGPSAPIQVMPVAAPGAPASLVAAAGNARITLTWSAVPQAVGYVVKRTSSPGGPYTIVARPTGSSCTDAPLVNGTTYYYLVSALNPSGESPPSPQASSTPVAPPPPPLELVATAGNGRVMLGWKACAGAANYRVMRSTTPGGPYTAIASPLETSHADLTVTNGTTYYYVVRAVNAGGKGAYSEQAQAMPVAPPSVPAGFTATPGDAQVSLAWAASARATGYCVKRASARSGPFVPIAHPAGTSYSDTTALNGSLYCYSVSATNAGGESAPSEAIEVCPAAPPPTPLDLRLSPANGQVALQWSAVPRAAHYAIRRGTTPGGPFATVATVPGTAYTDKGLANGSSYTYSITAGNASGESAPSAPVSARPIGPPSAPTSLSAAPGNGRASLAWAASPGATQYVVKRALVPGGSLAPVSRTQETSWVDDALTNGSTYLFAVSAVNAGGESIDSLTAEVTPLAPPGVPSGLSAAPGNGQVALAWSHSPRAAAYTVKRALTPNGPYAPIGQTPQFAYSDTGLANGTTYYYVVSARNDSGESLDSVQTQAMPVSPPGAPTELTATAGNRHVALAWTAISGASGYVVKRATTSGGAYSPIGSTAGTTFVDSTAQNGTTYYYLVTPVNAGGEGLACPEAKATPVSPPLAPARLSLSPGNGRITLAWSAVDGATRYRVKRATHASGPFAEISGPLVPTATDLAVTNDTTYYYAVTAVNPGGESPPSPTVEATPVAPPPTPTGVLVVAGNGKVSVTWNPLARATSYLVRRSSAPTGPWVLVSTPGTASCVDAGLPNGAKFYYAISAANAAGEGPPSAQVEATPVAPPPAPRGLKASAGCAQISLAWDAEPEAVGYTVKRSTSRGGPFFPVGNPTGTSLIDPLLENGTAYYYVVSAVNAGGESPDSSVATATPVVAPPAPMGLTASPSNGLVALAWGSSAGAIGYTVKRSTSPGGPFSPIAQASDPACGDAKVVNGTTYYYVVSAINAGGESADSPPAESTPVAPPAIPTGLTATPGNAQVSLAWTAAAGARAYSIKRSPERRGPFFPIASVGGTSYVDKDVVNGSTYFYIVTAVNAGGESQRSSRTGASPVEPPPIPTGLTARPGNGKVSLTWGVCEGARRYRLKRATERRGPYTQLAIVAQASHLDTTVVNGTTYYYIVSALNAGGASAYSTRAQSTPVTPPPPPASLAASSGDVEVSLLWTGSAGAARYSVHRSLHSGGPYERLAETSQTGMVDTSVENGRTYYYVVVAENAGGESPRSPQAQATPNGPPEAPVDLVAHPGDSHVTLLWKPVPLAAGYVVKRSAASEGPFSTLATPQAPSFTDTGLTNGVLYHYSVSATNSVGESPGAARIAVKALAMDDLAPLEPDPLATGALVDLPSPTPDVLEGAAPTVLLAPDREEVPTLESLPAPLPGAFAPAVDLERLVDLRRVEKLRGIFDATAQKLETWEVMCIVGAEGQEGRREMERLVRFRESLDEASLQEAALGFFQKILRIRSAYGGLVKQLRAHVDGLRLSVPDKETMEIAIAFLISAPRGRQRAQIWLDDPVQHRQGSANYMEHALSIAQKYRKALQSR
jgi:titin